MVYNIAVTITSTSVAQRLSTSNIPCVWVSLQCPDTNAADIYHGGRSTITSSTGEKIASGGGGGAPQYPPCSEITPYNLNEIFILGTANDIVKVRYMKR